MKKITLLVILICAFFSCANLPKLSDFDLKPVYSTDFSKPEKWETMASPTKTYAFVEGHYEVSYKTDNWQTYMPYWNKVTIPYSFSATASLVLADPAKDGHVCLVADYIDAGNFVRLMFNDAAEYRVDAYIDGILTPIQEWKKSSKIKDQGKKNTFQVFRTADMFFLFANGDFVAKFPFELKDTKVEIGIGTGCGTGENLTLATTRYYEFSVASVQNKLAEPHK
jgi:hypothetical protein